MDLPRVPPPLPSRRPVPPAPPAMSLDEYFSTGLPHERPIFEAVLRHVSTLGPVHVEPVSVGIFLKRSQTFAELRPKDRWVALSFSLPHAVEHERITRKVVAYHGRLLPRRQPQPRRPRRPTCAAG